MPTEKRARQKAARQQKKLAEQRRLKRRRLTRNSALIAGAGAVILVIALATTGAFSSSSPPVKAAASKKKASATTTTSTSSTTTTTTGPTSTTTTAATTTSTTYVAADAAADQAAANAAAVAAGCPATPATRTNTQTYSSAPAMTITTKKKYTALVKTTAGTFTISLDAADAPKTVNSFVFLAGKDFFNCNTFHRVIPGFMDQTGDPTGTGAGGPGYKIANENIPSSYATGDVAMANSGGTDTNGSQFFILVDGGSKTLDSDLSSGDKYTLFGTVTSGLTVVELINSEGNSTPSANGSPPDVIQRIISVTINES